MYALFWVSLLLGALIDLSSASHYAWINPFFVPVLEKYANLILVLMIFFGSITLVMVPVSLMLRYRKGSLLERQQIKLLALFGAILAAGTILGFIIYPLITGGVMFNRENNLFSLLFFASMGLFPSLAIGVAVLRYRLWDIDIIIRRTLVYGVLTAFLALAYFSSVILLQEVFQLVTGQHQSPLATVLSTLLIAALFTPLRKRIQGDIDRRFYRRKYDAQKTLERFALSARDEVELDKLSNELLTVVSDTMQPQKVSLWLRETRK
jgi:hypothetical protein